MVISLIISYSNQEASRLFFPLFTSNKTPVSPPALNTVIRNHIREQSHFLFPKKIPNRTKPKHGFGVLWCLFCKYWRTRESLNREKAQLNNQHLTEFPLVSLKSCTQSTDQANPTMADPLFLNSHLPKINSSMLLTTHK